MLTSKPSRGATRRTTRRLVAAVVGVLAVLLALPVAASATPVTVIPGLPPIEIPQVPGAPQIPGVPTPPAPAPKPTPKPAPKPAPETKQNPGVPAVPNVPTSTGWVALAKDSSHQIYWYRNGQFVKQMPISMGSAAHPTPNGVYHTKEKYRDMYMDSSTYGVPVNSAEGYRTYVEYATRMSADGIFIHAAPWSVAQQGSSNVSHGCINVSTANGKWVYDTIPQGTPIVVRGTVGGAYQGT